MSKQIVKMPVEQLKLGLYVARLDRPWNGTPFPFQGFEIESEEELTHLRRLCRCVFVEVTVAETDEPKSHARKVRRSAHKAKPPDPLQEVSKNLAKRLKPLIVKDPVPLRAELSSARVAYGEAKQTVSQVFARLQRGAGLDVPLMESMVDSMVDSVFRNRDAMSWLARMKTKDDYLYSHSLASSVWALAIGRHLGLDQETLGSLGTGAMLLDVGKTQLPTELLRKTAKPSEADWELIHGHVEGGLKLVSAAQGADGRLLSMISTHHERFDGSGYPAGLKGDAIPLEGRIAGIVDCYDAMTSERSYVKAKSTYDAVRELKRLSGSWFQPELVELFIQAVGVFPTGTLVELNTGEVGVVIAQNRFRRLRPELMLILDGAKKLRDDFTVIDLATCEANNAFGQPALWITAGLEPGAHGIDPTEYFL